MTEIHKSVYINGIFSVVDKDFQTVQGIGSIKFNDMVTLSSSFKHIG